MIGTLAKPSRLAALWSAGLLATVAVVLAACAQQPAAPATTAPSGAAPTAAPAVATAAKPAASPAAAQAATPGGPPIVIGKLDSLTGSLAFEGTRQRDGTMLAVKMANEEGGALGRQIVLKIGDIKSDPAAAVSALEDMVAREKPVAILGPYGSPFGVPLGQAMAKYGLPMTFSCGTLDCGQKVFSTYPWAFNVGPLQPYYHKGFIDLVKLAQQSADPPKTIAMAYVNTAFGEGLTKMIKEGFPALKGLEEVTGLKLVATEPYEPTATDLRPMLLRLKALNPDIVFAVSNTPDTILLTKQLREVGVPAKMLFFPFTPLYADVIKGLGAGLDGVSTIDLVGPDVNWPGSEKYPKLLPSTEEQRKLVLDNLGTNVDTPIYLGYNHAGIMISAIRDAGSTDKAAIIDALSKFKSNSSAGPVDYTKTGIAGEKHQSYQHMAVFQYQSGKAVPVSPSEIAKGKLQYPVAFK